MSSAIDLFMTYQFLRRLVMPFKEWRAFKLGIIDEKGNVLKKSASRTSDEESSLGYFDRLVLKMKKLLAYVPGGVTMFGSLAAAYMLLREGEELENLSDEEIMNRYELVLTDEIFLNECRDLGLTEDAPANSVGSGAIAGVGVGPQGEPGVDLRKKRRRECIILALAKRKAPYGDQSRSVH